MTAAKRISILVILLFLFSWVSINIYLPALPFLSQAFHTNEQNLKFSLTLFLTGFAFSQLIWGPVSEKYGRKNPIIVGLILATFGVVLTMVAPNVIIFNSGRFIEAVGLGCAPVLGRAILIDALDPLLVVVTMSYGSSSANIMPALAPIIGGYLLMGLGWRSIFAFLFLYGLGLLIFMWRYLPETHPNPQRDINIFFTFKHYLEAIRHRLFIGYLSPYMIVTGAMIAYYTVTPFIFITILHISPERYGYFSIATVMTYVMGAVLNQFLSARFGLQKTITMGLYFLMISAVLLIVFTFFATLNVITILIPMTIYTFAAGIICPSSNTQAMKALQHRAGAAAAVIGFSVYAMSAIFSTIITAVSITTLVPLMLYVCVVTIAAAGLFFSLVGKDQ